MKKITNVKRKKLWKLSWEGDIKELVSDRFTEHLGLFTFSDDFSKYCEAFSLDINNICNLVTLGNSFDDPKNPETHDYPSLEKPSHAATVLDGRYEVKFVSPDVINLFERHLSKDEISLCPRVLNLYQLLNTLTKRLLKKNWKPMAEN